MSKALQLLENIEKKYNEELKRTEEQLEKGIEQTSEAIKNSLNTRANITANAIQALDKKIDQNIAQSSKAIDSKLTEHQALLESKLSHLQQLNEQIESEVQKAHNKAVEKKLSLLNIMLISTAVIFLILILSLIWIGKGKYSEIEDLNNEISAQQAKVDHLNNLGGNLNITTCKPNNSQSKRLCILINEKQGRFGNGYYIPMGY